MCFLALLFDYFFFSFAFLIIAGWIECVSKSVGRCCLRHICWISCVDKHVCLCAHWFHLEIMWNIKKYFGNWLRWQNLLNRFDFYFRVSAGFQSLVCLRYVFLYICLCRVFLFFLRLTQNAFDLCVPCDVFSLLLPLRCQIQIESFGTSSTFQLGLMYRPLCLINWDSLNNFLFNE